jgi:uncharacterized protein (TIGR00369 family)
MATSPFLQLLGVRLARLHKDGLTLECPFAASLSNVFGGLHGGVYATVADAAAAFAIHYQHGTFRGMATVDLKINYFRPVLEGRMLARARMLRMGSTLCTAAVEMTDSQHRLVAAALVTYMILSPGQGTPHKAPDKA